MTQDIRDLVSDTCDLLGFGEPSHGDPAFGRFRNEAFARLAERGFRSFALETDRVAAFVVDDFVRDGVGTLDAAMSEGFSHGFGAFDANRELVAWMRQYNADRPAAERLAFHGIDAPLEFTAASPRRDLEYVRDYLGLELDLGSLVGQDERWSRMEAVTDPAASPGDTAEARQLRVIADDMLTALYAGAPELIASTSRATWFRAKAHVTSGLGLLRYHRQAAQHIGESERWSRLSATRDALMAQNLLDIRDIEGRRGPTMVSAANIHLQMNVSEMSMAGMDLTWFGTGAIIASVSGERYTFVAGSLDPSEGPRVEAPPQQNRIDA
ncbi:erythromycin esterase family protein [Glycomyces buryatensis]|uniref:Erythromycin esterase family protein n=1 Tax=Glycomyces buryatensis TaxID=2570927 RepID=A0A4S8QDN6_9ACTN|nr:erythromycin esterase family protein [Glycomyces buryatensis]THV42498.1 erythromycin esterase family protein [Glycomyces buryatensis]